MYTGYHHSISRFNHCMLHYQCMLIFSINRVSLRIRTKSQKYGHTTHLKKNITRNSSMGHHCTLEGVSVHWEFHSKASQVTPSSMADLGHSTILDQHLLFWPCHLTGCLQRMKDSLTLQVHGFNLYLWTSISYNYLCFDYMKSSLKVLSVLNKYSKSITYLIIDDACIVLEIF